MKKHTIKSVDRNSIAEELGIQSGDFLLSINNAAVIDILDYRFRVTEETLSVEIEKANGELWELDIEKDEDDDLGLAFENPLMSKERTCCNHCVFCFIEQQPEGLRETLYVKDDDPRLSFLMGNYATLTNMNIKEAQRLAGYHLSPLRISVHAADLDLRASMMGSERARNLFEILAVFSNAGIQMHFQVVLCKGINDGVQLDYTIETLRKIKGAASMSVVPVGRTSHREGLTPLLPFTKEDANHVIDQIHKHQQTSLMTAASSHFVYAADEWYVLAEHPFPTYESYEDFPQLDNGVGMLRMFEHDFMEEMVFSSKYLENTDAHQRKAGKKIIIITGIAAYAFMKTLIDAFKNTHPTAQIMVHKVQNDFFGHNVTVSGLITGQDIAKQSKQIVRDCHALFLPYNMIRTGVDEKIMIDGMTTDVLSDILNIHVLLGEPTGSDFYHQLLTESFGEDV